MKSKIILVAFICLFIMSCGNKEVKPLSEADETPPKITILSPSNNSSFNVGEDFNISVDIIEDTDNTVTLTCLIDGTQIFNGRVNVGIWNTIINTDDYIGNHSIYIKAEDASGNIGVSETIDFSVEQLSLTGTVTNSAGDRLDAVEIFIDNELVTFTDQDGNFNIGDIAPGDYMLTLKKQYFVDKEVNIVIESENNEVLITLDLIDLPFPQLTVEDKEYQFSLSWDELPSYVINGYNLYFRYVCPFAFTNSGYDWTDWERANASLIQGMSFTHDVEFERNTNYQYLLVPVGIDNSERPIESEYAYTTTALVRAFAFINEDASYFEPYNVHNKLANGFPSINLGGSAYERAILVIDWEWDSKNIVLFTSNRWHVQMSLNGGDYTNILTFEVPEDQPGGSRIESVWVSYALGTSIQIRAIHSDGSNDIPGRVRQVKLVALDDY